MLNTVSEGVPLHLRNATTSLMADIGYGKGYEYAHNTSAKITNMQCLPDNLKDRQYYVPTDQGHEKDVCEKLEYIRKVKESLK